VAAADRREPGERRPDTREQASTPALAALALGRALAIALQLRVPMRRGVVQPLATFLTQLRDRGDLDLRVDDDRGTPTAVHAWCGRGHTFRAPVTARDTMYDLIFTDLLHSPN
jgi:hypothetical protein